MPEVVRAKFDFHVAISKFILPYTKGCSFTCKLLSLMVDPTRGEGRPLPLLTLVGTRVLNIDIVVNNLIFLTPGYFDNFLYFIVIISIWI